jgi:hypothetical protein
MNTDILTQVSSAQEALRAVARAVVSTCLSPPGALVVGNVVFSDLDAVFRD